MLYIYKRISLFTQKRSVGRTYNLLKIHSHTLASGDSEITTCAPCGVRQRIWYCLSEPQDVIPDFCDEGFPLTCEAFTFGMHPAATPPTLHHLALVVLVIIALITERAGIPCKEAQSSDSQYIYSHTHTPSFCTSFKALSPPTSLFHHPHLFLSIFLHLLSLHLSYLNSFTFVLLFSISLHPVYLFPTSSFLTPHLSVYFSTSSLSLSLHSLFFIFLSHSLFPLLSCSLAHSLSSLNSMSSS